MNTPQVVVIGGGIGGLATAALLGKDGYQVTLLEKNNILGGRARYFKKDGYTFDMGPSWYMMPDAFENFFALFNKKPSDYYELMRLEKHYKIFFTPQRTYTIKKDLPDNVALFEKTEPGAGDKLKKYLEKSKKLYQDSMQNLVLQDYQSLFPLLKPSLLFKLLSFNLFESFHNYTKKYFQNSDLQKILEFTTVFLGGSPYNTPAFYTLIAHTDFNLGIWHPRGGIFQFIKALEKLCRENDVNIITGEPVEKIIVKKQAQEIITNKNKYPADYVVCNADYHYCETKLLDDKYTTYPSSYWKKKTMAPSAFLVYLGLNEKIPELEHHNLYFDQSWEKHFQQTYENPTWPENPSYYVHCPSRTDDSLAPAEGDVAIILMPVAAGLNDTDENRRKYRNKVIAHLENLIGRSLEDKIVTERIFSHRDFQNDYHAFQGAAFGLAHTLKQTGPLRPLNFSRKVPNLFYVGQYTNPGVGMPICLLSAQIVHNLINKQA